MIELSAARGTAPARTLPPAGPAWFGSVMGTGILATLLQTTAAAVPGAVLLARILLVLGVLVLAGLGIVTLKRLRPLLATDDSRALAQWGMVSMALLSIGSATSAVLPDWVPALAGAAWAFDAVMWVAGSLLGFLLTVVFTTRLLRRDPGEPTTVWGLAVVPPMVTATTGAGLVGHAGAAGPLVLAVSVVGFVVALCLGSVIFAVCYHHYWRAAPVPVALSASTWIPLGIVGQSVAAAHALSAVIVPGVAPDVAIVVMTAVHGYGVMMLIIGAPLVAWAGVITARGFLARMPFSPGWWALTFPIGTIALGSHLLAASTGWVPVQVISGLAVITLVGTWTLCASASGRAVAAAGARAVSVPLNESLR